MTSTVTSPSSFLLSRNEVLVTMTAPLKEYDGPGRTSHSRAETESTSEDMTSFGDYSEVSSRTGLDESDRSTSMTREELRFEDEDDSETSTSSGVRFRLKANKVHFVRALSDMPDFERRAVWHTRESYDIINGANNITAKLLRIGRENPERFGHCFRGLEHRAPTYRMDRDKRTRESREAVLEEQCRQLQAHRLDAHAIDSEEESLSPAKMLDHASLRRVYRHSTLSSLEIALTMAEEDAQAAVAYHQEYASSTPPKHNNHSNSGLSSQEFQSPSSRHRRAPVLSEDEEALFDLKVPLEDDDVSILSEDEHPEVEDLDEFNMYATEGKGLMSRLKRFVGGSSKKHRGRRRSSGTESISRGSVVSGSNSSIFSAISGSSRSSLSFFRRHR